MKHILKDERAAQNSLSLGVVGAGHMSYAIITGVMKRDIFPPERITVFGIEPEMLNAHKALGVEIAKDNCSLVSSSDLIILAVKPQTVEAVMKEINPCLEGKCLVSIAAGVSRDFLRRFAPAAYIVRVMPNTPLLVGYGASAVTPRGEIPENLYQAAVSIFSAAGEVAFVDDEHMNAIIGVNGSSPAYFFRMANAMVNSAVKQGIDPDVALRLTARTMEGAAQMLLHSGKTAQELTDMVCSPGGTTIAALTAFDEMGFDRMIDEAMLRCTKRAGEIGK
jgi:pyrroline-5-carboxylate reductase